MLNEVKNLQSLHIIYTKNNLRKSKKLSILEYNICRLFVIKILEMSFDSLWIIDLK